MLQTPFLELSQGRRQRPLRLTPRECARLVVPMIKKASRIMCPHITASVSIIA